MKPFSLSIGTLIVRFYLMMAIIIGAIFAGMPWLALLALPVFLSAMMGISFSVNKAKTVKTKERTNLGLPKMTAGTTAYLKAS